MKYAIGVDLGGTNIVTILMSEKGRIVSRDKRPTECRKGKDHVLNRISESIQAVIRSQGSGVRDKKLWTMDYGLSTAVAGIGIGTPGMVDLDSGIVYEAPNLKGWDNVPLAKIYSKQFGLPVFLENDANAAALGEWWTGAGKGTKNLICLTLGTGIGGGIIIDGAVYHGSEGYAGELGHISISMDGPECGCGSTGCLEVYASAHRIIKKTVALLKEKKNRGSLILKLADNKMDGVNPEIITRAAEKGDRLARKIWNDTGYYLGSGIASLVNTFNPDMIVLTGGMTGAKKFFFPSLWKTVRKRAFKTPVKNLRIEIGKLPDDAGAVGAAKTAFQRTNK